MSSTRLRVPKVPATSVRRNRLIEKAIGRDPVTLVCAPAGSGKTMAVADWANFASADSDAVAWLTIDDADDRPYEFWSAVIEAFIAVAPPEAAARLDSLSPPRHGLEPGFVAALVEVLASEVSLRWLVLDDAHRLRNPDVLAGIDLLVTPEADGLGVVLACRSEPRMAFHRWRLDGVLGEVRGPDLAFTDSEANEMLIALEAPVRPAEVTRLVARTEGWAAGLRLAAVSLEASADPARFIAEFEGDERAVADYLFAEIVQHLDPDLKEFLLATCAPGQLPVELAAELSGRTDAGDVLDRLCRANALVVQSGEPSWYRYHSLLRGYLLTVLARRDVQAPYEQHARTSRWFDRNGEPVIALDHAVESRDSAFVRDLIHRNGLRLVMFGQAEVVRDTIGPPSGLLADDERIAAVAALAALETGDLVAADEWLAIVRKLGPSMDASYSALAASAELQRALLGGDATAALAESGVLEIQPTGDLDVDLMVLAHRPAGRMRVGDYQGVAADLDAALRIARSRGYDQLILWVLSQRAGMCAARCDFKASAESAHDAIEFADRRGWADSPRLAYAYLVAAWTDFQTGGPRQAVWAERGLASLDGVNNVEVETAVRCMHAVDVADASEGNERRDAAATLHSLLESTGADISPALNSLATQQSVRLSLAVGRPEWAREAADRLQRQLPGCAEPLVALAGIRAARGLAQDALDLLEPVLSERVRAHVPTTLVLARVLAASLERSQGHMNRAFEILHAALAWAAPNNFRRPFLDAWDDVGPLFVEHRGRFGTAEGFVGDLVEDQRPDDVSRVGLLNQSLSDREFEVLRDLPSLMTVAQIAAAQGVSENTVKTHVRSVYLKLGVRSRGAAVREARARGLI